MTTISGYQHAQRPAPLGRLPNPPETLKTRQGRRQRRRRAAKHGYHEATGGAALGVEASVRGQDSVMLSTRVSTAHRASVVTLASLSVLLQFGTLDCSPAHAARPLRRRGPCSAGTPLLSFWKSGVPQASQSSESRPDARRCQYAVSCCRAPSLHMDRRPRGPVILSDPPSLVLDTIFLWQRLAACGLTGCFT